MSHYERYEAAMYAGATGSPYAVDGNKEDELMTLAEARNVAHGLGWAAMLDAELDELVIQCIKGKALLVVPSDRRDCWDVRLVDEDEGTDTHVGQPPRTAMWLRRTLVALVEAYSLTPIQAEPND